MTEQRLSRWVVPLVFVVLGVSSSLTAGPQLPSVDALGAAKRAAIDDRHADLIRHLRRAVRQEPRRVEPRQLLGLFLHALGREAEAQTAIHELCEVDADAARVARELAQRVGQHLREPIPVKPASSWPPTNHAILALGSPVQHDGKPAPRLLSTLQTDLKLARQDPKPSLWSRGRRCEQSLSRLT